MNLNTLEDFQICISVPLIILEKLFFPIKRKKGVNDCFKTVVSSVLTTIASRLKSEQKKRKNKSFDTYHKS